jgi:NADPH:quinone reductase-like Zn-dependent oxidoreductase
MKAIVQDRYGSTDTLTLRSVPKPTAKDDEVLVRVRAASVNMADVDYMRGTIFARFGGPLRPKDKVPGSDMAGQVEAVGDRVSRFQLGDEVFGDLSVCGSGAFAEFASVPEDVLSSKPSGMTFEQAATLPQAAILALQGLRDDRPLLRGHKVLVNGAGGGVGSFAVQIAKAFGAEVTGVDSAEKLALMGSIGADHVIDYRQTDYVEAGQRYDRILDVVASHSLLDYRRVLRPAGTFVMAGGPTSRTFQALVLGPVVSRAGSRRLGVLMWRPNDHDDVASLKELIAAGDVTPIIDRTYSLDETPQALDHVAQGRAQGKVVITM